MAEISPQKSRISETVSIVAHQLKNPLSVLKGYLEVLISGDLGKVNPKQKEYLSDSLENIGRMAQIVNYLLDVSRIEEGKYALKSEKFSLEELTCQVVKNLALWARAANSKIFFTSQKNLPLVLSDQFKIRQVIENLISNSLKFKGAGQGKIEISLAKKGGNVLFSCKDNGVGIPQEDKKKVFSKFYRSEEAMALDPSGNGLGLYINKAIIDLSRGKIWFEKNRGPGMTFYFTLPIAK